MFEQLIKKSLKGFEHFDMLLLSVISIHSTILQIQT